MNHINMLRTKARYSWLFPIYVPSYSRAGTSPLLNILAQADRAVQSCVHIVVRPEEAQAYRTAYPWAFIVREGTPGIGPARMKCLKDADRRGYRYITVLDDDIIHVSLLERIQQDSGKMHTRRYSAKVSGMPERELLPFSLAVACRIARSVFRERPDASYGAARNALFSGDVDVTVGATLNKGSFPACVMFFDVKRFQMRQMPERYQWHGEDLAMYLHTLSQGQEAFTLPGVAYDQHGSIVTTIPLDPLDEVARTPDLEAAVHEYPLIYPYLRPAVVNKAGGIMRIGVNWKRWYKDTESEPVEIPLSHLIKETV